MFAFSYGYSRVAVSAAVVVVALYSFDHLYRHLFIVFFILRWPGFTCVGPFFLFIFCIHGTTTHRPTDVHEITSTAEFIFMHNKN